MHRKPNYNESPREFLRQPGIYVLLPKKQLDQELTVGAISLLCLMRTWHDMSPDYASTNIVRTPPGGWHGIIGCPQPSVARWHAELRKRHFIAIGKNGNWWINDANPAGQKYVKIPLFPLLDRKLSRRAKRIWMALQVYADFETGSRCFPSLRTLAKDTNLHVSNVKLAIRDLKNARYVRATWGRKSRVYELYASGDAPLSTGITNPHPTYPNRTPQTYPNRTLRISQSHPPTYQNYAFTHIEITPRNTINTNIRKKGTAKRTAPIDPDKRAAVINKKQPTVRSDSDRTSTGTNQHAAKDRPIAETMKRVNK